MSRYTMTLAELMERYSPGSDPFALMDIGRLVKDAEPFLFPVPYPIWDEDYRNVLNTKIITHYLYREIGFDTPARFIFELCNKLNEVMPYYNQLYKLQLDGLQSLIDMDLYEEYMGEGATHDVSSKTVDEDTRQETSRQAHTAEQAYNFNDLKHNGGEQVKNSGKDTTDTTYGRVDTTLYTNLEDKKDYNSNDTTEYGSYTDTDAHNVNKFSNTPQGGLEGIESDRYLTTATIDSIDQTVQNNGKDTVKHTGYDTSTRNGEQKVSASGKDSVDVQHGLTVDTKTNYEDASSGGSNSDAWTTDGYLDNKINNIKDSMDASGTKSDSYLKHTWGRTGAKDIVEEVMQLRDAIINIDMMIINDLNDLFMGLY